MKTIIARFAGTLVVLSTLALATPAYAFSFSSFFHFFGGNTTNTAAQESAAANARNPMLNPTLRTASSSEDREMHGNATSTADRRGEMGRGRTLSECIRNAEQTRNTAIRSAQVALQAAQKNRTGAASSTQSVAARASYKAATKAAQDAFAAARKACQSLQPRTSTTASSTAE